MAETSYPKFDTTHYFVDEAGDPTLFDRQGRIIVGNDGCSEHFILGKLDVDNPAALTAAMEALRTELLADPYFKGIPSMQPGAQKTVKMFHAKDDLPEVRREVYKLLLIHKLKFYAVVRNKRELASYVKQQNERRAAYRYRENELYDTLVSHLFRSRLYKADRFQILFAKRGKSDRTAALKRALEVAINDSEQDLGIKNTAEIEIESGEPAHSAGLQAVDYFLWALQRFFQYEKTDKCESECRYVKMLWPMVGEINDLDFVLDGKRGTLWNLSRELTPDARKTR